MIFMLKKIVIITNFLKKFCNYKTYFITLRNS